MSNIPSDENRIQLKGRIEEAPVCTHSVYNEKFYKTTLAVPRLSSATDSIPLTFPEKLLTLLDVTKGDNIAVSGQLRSYNHMIKGRSRLILTVFVTHLSPLTDDGENSNQVFLQGYICRPPVFRTTPFGREITDLLLAVNRPYNKSDYIPAIAWGRNARYTQHLSVGQKVQAEGRLQSRVYQKKYPDGSTEERTAYEVSLNTIEPVSEEDPSIF